MNQRTVPVLNEQKSNNLSLKLLSVDGFLEGGRGWMALRTAQNREKNGDGSGVDDGRSIIIGKSVIPLIGEWCDRLTAKWIADTYCLEIFSFFKLNYCLCFNFYRV